MNIWSYLQKQSLFFHYLSLAIVVFGLVVLFKMQREARPNVNFNRVNVSVAYPGASPSDVEELIIDPIEEKIAQVDGVEQYKSVSYNGAGSISIRIDDNYPNVDEIIDELRRKINEVSDLPQDVKDIVISEAKAQNIPVLNIALYGDLDPFSFKMETEKLKDFLMLQEGVQSVSYSGLNDLQMIIQSKPKQLKQFDITVNEIFNKLSAWAKQRPGGIYENQSELGSISIGQNLNSIANLQNFVLRSNDSGKDIRLSDLSDIEFDLQQTQNATLFEDKDAVLLTVIKKPFVDAIDIVDALKISLHQYRQNLNPSLNIKLYRDQSIRIRNKLKIVMFNALGGLILVLLILIVFLDWRSALITSIGIPVAILGGMIVLYLLGQSINSLLVVGVIIVLGMLVDDAVVVCENIYAYIEKGLNPTQAALKGVSEIALPVMASVLTTVFAFLPIVFTQEIIGQFLRVIPITVIALLSISLLEALFILPIHASEIMVQSKQRKQSFFKFFERLYAKYIVWSLRYRIPLLLLLLVFFIFSAFQGKKMFERFRLFPSDGLNGFSVRLQLPKNSPLYKTKLAAKDLSRQLLDISDNGFDTIYSNIGQVTTGGSSGSRQNGAHLAMINVGFVSDASFKAKEKQLLKNIRQTVQAFSQKTSYQSSLTLDRPGPPVGKPIQLQITSKDFDFGQQISNQLKTQLGQIKGVHSLQTDLDGDSQQYRFLIKNDLAVSEGINPTQISRLIFASSTGLKVTDVLKNNEKIDIVLKLQKQKYSNIKDSLKLRVRNSYGQAVPIKSYVDIVKEKGASSIQRLNGSRTITLFGEVDDSIVSGKQVNAAIKPFIQKLKQQYPAIKITIGGGERDRLKAVKDTLKLYGFALMLIFMVISLSFRSVLYPFLVLSAIPMGLSGVVWALVLHDKSLSLMGIIGVVGLSGVVVNVSILFLKFIQDRLQSQSNSHAAIVSAGVSRLRPIVMTTLSTLIGLLPTIYGMGGTDSFVQPIALVLGWGLFVATLLTLLFLPAIASCFSRFLVRNTSLKSD